MSEKIERTQIANVIIKTIAPGSLYHKRSCFSVVKTIMATSENVLNYQIGALNSKVGS